MRLATLEQIPEYVRRGLHERAGSARTRAQADTRPLELHGIGGTVSTFERRTSDDPQRLTRREAEILELLAVGHSDAAIANRLFISQRTVNNHVHAILNKLGVQNRTQAASYARKRPNGLAQPEAAEG